MRGLLACLTALLALCGAGCQKPSVTVLIGATAVLSPGGPALPDSIVVISGGRIRAVGLRKDVPVPQDSERLDLTGRFLTAPAGGRLAAGEPADLEVHQGSAAGPVNRRMQSGEWR